MRNCSTLVIHHSHTDKTNNLNVLSSFNKTHYKSLHKPYLQEKSGTKYEHIAYHYCIFPNGKIVKTRMLDTVGYHASNLSVNKKSIGVCLVGNFDKEKPEIKQVKSLQKLITEMNKKYNKNLEIAFHRDFSTKTCPGKNFTKDLINAGEYELLFKLGKNNGITRVIQDIDQWIAKTGIKRELGFSILIMLNRI